jgi:two-component system sensor histidine kinase DesK
MPPQDQPSKTQLPVPLDLYGRTSTSAGAGSNYLWLAYSVFFFIEPVLRNTPRYWLTQLPIYAVFLALYITYVQVCRRAIRLAILGGFFVLGLIALPSNVGASSFFIYVVAMLPFCTESTPAFFAVMLLEVATLAIENRFISHANPINYAVTGFFAVVVGVSNLFIAQGKRADLKLRLAQEENIQLAAVAERERIARDLHDVLGHTLSVVVLKAELAGRLIGKGTSEAAARAATEIADVERTARTALAEVREAIGGYRAKGLAAEVEQARQTLDAAGVRLVCKEKPPVLRAREETVLSLIVREAVTNIVRHAQATECTMHFTTTTDGFAHLEVADNGQASTTSTPIREGNGLRGMRERILELGGRFRIESEAGTRLVIELPAASLAAASLASR